MKYVMAFVGGAAVAFAFDDGELLYALLFIVMFTAAILAMNYFERHQPANDPEHHRDRHSGDRS